MVSYRALLTFTLGLLGGAGTTVVLSSTTIKDSSAANGGGVFGTGGLVIATEEQR